MSWELFKDGNLYGGQLVAAAVGWDTPTQFICKPCVYKIIAGGKPYIGVTKNLNMRWYQHKKDAEKSSKVFYRALKEDLDNKKVLIYVIFETKNRLNLEQFETLEIKKHNSFLDGWNQQLANELTSQTLRKYILDYKMLKDPQLLEQIEWKLQYNNMPRREVASLTKLLWGKLDE